MEEAHHARVQGEANRRVGAVSAQLHKREVQMRQHELRCINSSLCASLDASRAQLDSAHSALSELRKRHEGDFYRDDITVIVVYLEEFVRYLQRDLGVTAAEKVQSKSSSKLASPRATLPPGSPRYTPSKEPTGPPT